MTGAIALLALVAAALWLLSEWLRGWAFTGFPWLVSGYSQTPPSPLAGFAALFGVYGVGGLLALVSALGVVALHGRNWRPAALAVLVLGSGFGLRQVSWTEPVGAPVRVALLQTNIEQSLKWRPEMLQQWLDRNVQMLRDNPAELVVLPAKFCAALQDLSMAVALRHVISQIVGANYLIYRASVTGLADVVQVA